MTFSCSPKTSQELTINTSLWTANRNRIHTMHIFINSCPFYKFSAYMNHSSLVTVHLIVGDLQTFLSSGAPTMPEAKHHCTGGTNSTRLHELALVQTWSTVSCHCRAKSGLILQITNIVRSEINAMMHVYWNSLLTSPYPFLSLQTSAVHTWQAGTIPV